MLRLHLHVVRGFEPLQRTAGQFAGYEDARVGTHWGEEHGTSGSVKEDAGGACPRDGDGGVGGK